jgi:AcrR family transcriptional regulator
VARHAPGKFPRRRTITPTTSIEPSATSSPSASSARGRQTRERLLDAAERLWGERGVEGVSLREIRIAAGQRNSSALQFHYGNRDGLLLALTRRHLPRLEAIREGLHDALVAAGREDDLAGLTEVLVRPTAEYLRQGPSARAWVKISAERFARPETGLRSMTEHAPALGLAIGARVFQELTTVLDPDVALERLLATLVTAHHMCADRARVEDAPSSVDGRPALPFDRWVANMLDMALAALTAPPRAGAPAGHPLLPLPARSEPDPDR